MQVLIIGAGEVGFHTALRLSHEGHRVVVVDNYPERVRQVSEQMDVQTLVGQGSSPAVLRAAGVDQADLVLVVTNSDEVNLAACRFARLLAPAATLIARIRSTDYLDFFEEVGRGQPGRGYGHQPRAGGGHPDHAVFGRARGQQRGRLRRGHGQDAGAQDPPHLPPRGPTPQRTAHRGRAPLFGGGH